MSMQEVTAEFETGRNALMPAAQSSWALRQQAAPRRPGSTGPCRLQPN